MTLAANLVRFGELRNLPRTLQPERTDKGEGVEAALVAQEAQWHHTCQLH